jgi:hypothetical protein
MACRAELLIGLLPARGLRCRVKALGANSERSRGTKKHDGQENATQHGVIDLEYFSAGGTASLVSRQIRGSCRGSTGGRLLEISAIIMP